MEVFPLSLFISLLADEFVSASFTLGTKLKPRATQEQAKCKFHDYMLFCCSLAAFFYCPIISIEYHWPHGPFDLIVNRKQFKIQ